MESTENKPDKPERDPGVALEMLACAVAAVILTALAYGLTRWLTSWIGTG